LFNPTFNNISVISWQAVLLLEETGVPRGNWSTQRKLEYPEETGVPRENPDLPQVTDKLYHIKLY
jgi:hypothetical protein